MGIDWTGLLGRMVPRGIGSTGSRGKASTDDVARFFVGPCAGSLIGIFGIWLVVAVNPWLGCAVLAFSARRWQDFLATQKVPQKVAQRPQKAKRRTCREVYAETLQILGNDPLVAALEETRCQMRDHGKEQEVACEIALRHHEHDIRALGLNLPCF
jgi:hypothetical protein